MSYQERLHTKAVVRLSDNAIIGPENKKDWKIYRKWLSEGNKPIPADIPKTPVEEKTVEEKLASIGLTKEQLKELLGL